MVLLIYVLTFTSLKENPVLARTYDDHFLSNPNLDNQAHLVQISGTPRIFFLAISLLLMTSPSLVNLLLSKISSLNLKYERPLGTIKFPILHLKLLNFIICLTLTYSIFKYNYSPKPRKISIICLMPEPGTNLSHLNKYRPISLLPQLSKVVEYVIKTQLQHYID